MSSFEKLTLATLCDMVLGENALDRSDDALVRAVRRKLNALEDAKYLLSEIAKDDVNVIDKAQKWMKEHVK